jgi:rhodanese-related sulfurtransferase
MLMDRGFGVVRPLAGGLYAWLDAGLDVESARPPVPQG